MGCGSGDAVAVGQRFDAAEGLVGYAVIYYVLEQVRDGNPRGLHSMGKQYQIKDAW